MPSERYFIEETLLTGASCELKGSEFHHLAHVMRTKTGEEVELVNGRGALASATVDHLGKTHAVLHVQRLLMSESAPTNHIILAQAIPKPNRLDVILEKGTELGVDSFWLFPGSLSAKRDFFPHQLDRARLLTIAAMKQCGRLTLPLIEFKPPLQQWPALKNVLPFFGDVNPAAPLFRESFHAVHSSLLPVLFFTGPESGFSEQEESILKDLGAKGVKLHNNILRTETASMVALSLISHWLL